MSEQDSVQPSTKQRRSRKINPANQQNGKQAPAVQRPANDDTEAWKAYWKAQDQSWRTEPEISLERQNELKMHWSIVSDIYKGIYPFKGMKLNRTDMEWLLATHNSGHAPLDGTNKRNSKQMGLDVRGANLSQADLHQLPLTKLLGGLTFFEYMNAPEEQQNAAVVLMEDANLDGVQLNGALLDGARLNRASLNGAQLNGASLRKAQLEEARLEKAQLEGANLSSAKLNKAYLMHANLEGANFGGAQLERATLAQAKLNGASSSWHD